MPDTPPPSPEAEYRRLDGPREYEEALDAIIALARHSLRIFERDLRGQGYNGQRRFDLLQQFLLRNRAARLVIILHDSDYLLRECPRMLNLIRQFSHAIEVYQTTDAARGVYDPFVIVDNEHNLHRFHYDNPRAALTLNDKEGSLDMVRRFDEIRDVSEAVAPPTTLGL